jgi:hypothetical protein
MSVQGSTIIMTTCSCLDVVQQLQLLRQMLPPPPPPPRRIVQSNQRCGCRNGSHSPTKRFDGLGVEWGGFSQQISIIDSSKGKISSDSAGWVGEELVRVRIKHASVEPNLDSKILTSYAADAKLTSLGGVHLLHREQLLLQGLV